MTCSIDLHSLQPQLTLCNINFAHQLLVGVWDIVEGEHAVAQFEKEEGAEGDEGPEGELWSVSSRMPRFEDVYVGVPQERFFAGFELAVV